MTAFAQDPSAVSAAQAACGPSNVKFDVKDDNSQHTIGQPEAGKALVYVIQDLVSAGSVITKVALDGVWVGAYHNDSYFSFAVDPGERHLCASWQSRLAGLSQIVGLAHFTAEAGRVYYFRTKAFGGRYEAPSLDLDPIDSDLGKFFVASIPLSISHPKEVMMRTPLRAPAVLPPSFEKHALLPGEQRIRCLLRFSKIWGEAGHPLEYRFGLVRPSLLLHVGHDWNSLTGISGMGFVSGHRF
jgi:hypothetical protein